MTLWERECDLRERGQIVATIPLDRLREIAAAEREGRLVMLPCWKRVFIISYDTIQKMKMCHYRGNAAGIYDMRCECADQYADCEAICNNDNEKACAYNFRVAEIGKTVFLTRAEAEFALAGKGAE